MAATVVAATDIFSAHARHASMAAALNAQLRQVRKFALDMRAIAAHSSACHLSSRLSELIFPVPLPNFRKSHNYLIK
jgi:hypothetical protein